MFALTVLDFFEDDLYCKNLEKVMFLNKHSIKHLILQLQNYVERITPLYYTNSYTIELIL